MRRIAIYFCLIFSVVNAHKLFAQQPHQFSFGNHVFLLDGKPFQIISGEMHPARIPRIYWRQRIQMAKAMGCNTIAIYIFWNYHEIKPGIFDFKSDNRDIAQFIRICQQEGMWVLLRPGPYVCAEWDLGGLPFYLLKIPDIKLRCMDDRYMSAVGNYVKNLAAEITSLQCTHGGPILMLQIENEYGSYGNDKNYLEALRKLWTANGIDIPFYTSDGATDYMLEAGSIPGAAIGLDSGIGDDDFAHAEKQSPGMPSFSSETYPGWLTHWKEKWARTDSSDILTQLKYLLSHKKSFSLYVVHGGTNFGFTAGANAFSSTQYQPDVTSYDYDAPINEQGAPTPKYFAIRSLLMKYVDYKIPPVPAAPKTISIAPFLVKPYTTIWNNLPNPVLSVQPKPMEDFDQSSGLILYRTKLVGHKSGKLTITEPHDFAMVFVDGKLIDTIFRDGGKWTIDLPATTSSSPVLDILVEAMGHINFAQFMIDRKGITDRVTLNGMTLMNWQTFPMPFDDQQIASFQQSALNGATAGIFFKADFQLTDIGDTYFDISNFKKGILWVNGHNLGRYWNVGPQFQLYCPASWLKKGANNITVFDFHKNTAAEISGVGAMAQ